VKDFFIIFLVVLVAYSFIRLSTNHSVSMNPDETCRHEVLYLYNHEGYGIYYTLEVDKNAKPVTCAQEHD